MADYISKFQYNGTTWDMKDAEARQALASCVNNGYYDSNAKKIILRHDSTTIVQIDATDFIKDGMVSNVQVVNGYLVITFNTDAGQEPIRIPITDIFNPDNYYTKSATNVLLALKQDLIQDLAQIRQGANAGATAYQKPQGGIPLSDINQNGIDNVPTNGSNNLVRSGGVQNELALGAVYDVSAHNNSATFASLQALLSNANIDTLIPTSVRKGGMSIKFVQSSDNKYVQHRYSGTETTGTPNPFLDTNNWTSDSGGGDAEFLTGEKVSETGIDDEPTADSENLVKSGGVYANYARQDGYYETLGVGEAKNIIGQIPQDAGFIYRTAGGGSEIADGLSHVKKIQGNVVSLNQLIELNKLNGEETANGITFSITNGYYNIQGTANASKRSMIIAINLNFNLVEGHKYYCDTVIPGLTFYGGANISFPPVNMTSAKQIVVCEPQHVRESFFYHQFDAIINTSYNAQSYPKIIDLTIIYGAGKEPTTVEQFEADYQRWFGKPLDYEPYNEGTLVPMNMQGIKTVGFNQYNPTTGIVKGLVVNGGYQITGAYTSITQDGVEITPNANGIFTIEKAGDIVVNGGDDTTCVHFVYDGHRNGEYEAYWEETKSIPTTTLKGKLNGQGESVTIFPDGMRGVGGVSDELHVSNGKTYAIKRIGSVYVNDLTNLLHQSWRILAAQNADMCSNQSLPCAILCSKYMYYGSSLRGGVNEGTCAMGGGWIAFSPTDCNGNTYNDLASFISAMQNVPIIYQLKEPLIYEVEDFELPINYKVDNYGTEEIIVPASQDDVPSSCNPWMAIQYDINAAEHIDTFEKHGIKDVALHDNLQALCNVINTNCSEQLGGTIAISAEPNDSLVYSFTFTANAQTQSVSPQNETI